MLKFFRKLGKPALKLGVSAALIFFVYSHTPMGEIAVVLAHSNAVLLMGIFFLLIGNTTMSALKWRILLLSDQIDIPLAKLVISYLIAGFFNLFLPSSIGGDAYRVYDVRQQSRRGASTAASVVADRLSGFVALACLSFGASFWVAARFDRPALVALPALVLSGLALALFLLRLKRPVVWLLHTVRLDRVPKVAAFSDEFFAALSCYGQKKRLLWQVLFLSFAFQFFLIVAVYLMARSIQAQAPFAAFLAFVPMITLMEALPVSVYGIGVRDMAYVFFFQTVGMDAVHCRALPVLFVALTLCYALVGGVLYAWRSFFATLSRRKNAQDGP